MEAPSRTRASLGTPRNDARVARYEMPSSRLVLPSPFDPRTTVRPGGRVRSADP